MSIENGDKWRVSQTAVALIEDAAKKGKSTGQTILVEGPRCELASYKYVVRIQVEVLELGGG
jgi:hypothetical protein